MRLTRALGALCLTATAVQAAWFGGEQKTLDKDAQPVPGDNPLEYCKAPDDYLLEIDNVDLDPNPPKAGEKLVITASGTVLEDVDEDAKIHLQVYLHVKYSLIRILDYEAALCDYVGQVDLKCPIKKGDLNLTKTVDLPSRIPNGQYTALADLYTKDHTDTLTCLSATVAFKSS
ncbi:MAG: Phosphatidylglycerol/phosphatidylinositol transfer protein [Alyxoria varia]|nr:MAG: Phosphatidylglycerol/phosphatidylinositol transfer protein [Alyxoria varia]